MIQFWTACCQPAGLKCSVFSFEWKSQTSDDWCAAVTLHDEAALQQLLSTYNKRSGYGLGSKNNAWLYNHLERWAEPWFPARFDSAKKGKKGIGGKGAEGYRPNGGGIASGGQGAGKGVPLRHREPEPWKAGCRSYWDVVEEGRAKGRKYAEFDGTGNGGDWWRGMAQGSGIGGKGTGGDGKSGDGKSIGKGIGGGQRPGSSGDGSAGGKGGAQGIAIAGGKVVGTYQGGKVVLDPPEAKGPEPRSDAREQRSLDMALGSSCLDAGVGSSVDSCLDSSAIGGTGTAGGGQGIEEQSDSKKSPTRGRSEEVRQDCTNSEHCQGIEGGSQGRSQPVNSRSHPGFQGQFCDDCECAACGTYSCGCGPACRLNLRSHPRYEGQRCGDCGCADCGTRSCGCGPACNLGLWSCGSYVTPSIHVETPRTTTASSGDGGQGIGIENPDANANSQCIENPDANANSQCKQPVSWLQHKREKAAAAAEARIPGQILGCLDTFEPRSAQGIKEQYAAKGIASTGALCIHSMQYPPEHQCIADSDSDTDHGRNPPLPLPENPHPRNTLHMHRALHPLIHRALHPHPDDIAGANDKGIAHSKLDAQIVCWT